MDLPRVLGNPERHSLYYTAKHQTYMYIFIIGIYSSHRKGEHKQNVNANWASVCGKFLPS